ncbi:hypothetical protein ACHAPM_011678 [Fusarium culmorum]
MERHPRRVYAPYIPLELRNTAIEDTNYDPGYERPRRRKRLFRERLGATSIVILFMGSAIVVILFIALALMWKESIRVNTAGEPNVVWARIIDANWATRVVTMSMAVIRTAMATQASLATAMLAAVVLETTGTPLLQGPIYSVIRAVQAAPTTLLLTAKLRPKGRLSTLVFTLVVIEILVTLASQFFSTIFISDFELSTYANIINATDVSTFDTLDVPRHRWFEIPPASSWTFAELSESFTKGPNFHDTGHTYRSFLPFGDEGERTHLRYFRGPATIMDHRVVCANPLLINLDLNTDIPSFPRLSGQIALNTDSYSMFHKVDDTQHYVNFTCALPTPLYLSNTTEGETSLCHANAGVDWAVMLEDPLVYPLANVSDPEDDSKTTVIAGFPKASTMFMIIDTISEEALLYGNGARHAAKSIREEGPWTLVSNGSNVEALRVTACLANLLAPAFTVDMYSSGDNLEPRISWDDKVQKYDTETSRHQLGASLTPRTLKDRGVLTLAPKSQWKEFPLPAVVGPYSAAWYFSSSVSNAMSRPEPAPQAGNETMERADPGLILSNSVKSLYNTYAYRTHVDLFQDTLRATKSPALATQALMARIYQMAYYEQLVKLSSKAKASTSFSSTDIIPVRWAGFAAATALIVTHFAVIATITVLFARFTESSMIGNYWQAVSQVFSRDTQQVVEKADRMSDKDVMHWAERESLSLECHGALQYQPDGRIVLRARQK